MPSIADFLSISFNGMRKRKLRSWLTMLGIIIGIAAVVSLISLGDGLRTAITGQFGSLSADKLTVQNSGTGFGPPGSTAIRKLTSHDLDLIKNVNGVKAVIPQLIRVVKVEYNRGVNFGYVASVPQDQKELDALYSASTNNIGEGRKLKIGDSGKIVAGSEFTKSDLFGKPVQLGTRLKIQGKDFEVIGILASGSSLIINGAVIMGEKDLKSLLNIGDEIDEITVQVDPSQAEAVAQRIEKVLRKDRNEKSGEEDFSVQTPLQAVSSVNTILNIINLIVAGIAFISLIIGGIGIANTMYTGVLERTKEIGTMKAIGAKNSDILLVFMIESGLLGLAGGIIGALVGLGVAFGVSGIANSALGSSIISVSVNYTLLIGAVAFSFAVGLISGLFPARQASKLKPVDALRG